MRLRIFLESTVGFLKSLIGAAGINMNAVLKSNMVKHDRCGKKIRMAAVGHRLVCTVGKVEPEDNLAFRAMMRWPDAARLAEGVERSRGAGAAAPA